MNLSHEEDENSLSLYKFESMLKTNKVFFFDSEEFEDIILHYIDTGRLNLAKKALKLGLEQHPKSTGLKLVQVEMLIYEAKLDVAEKILNELFAIEPTNEEIYIQKANIHSKRDEHEKAIAFLRIALKYSDDSADVYSMIAMEYLFMDNLELAKENFIMCLDEDSEDYTALYNVVYCFDFLDQNEDAIIYLTNFIDKNPFSEVAWHQLGRQYYALKRYDKAVWAFEYATLIDEGFLGAYMEKAKSHEKLKNYDEAIDCYKIAIELDNPSSFVFLRLAKCYEKIGNIELALKFFLKTVHEDPLLDKGWIAITDFYIRQKDYQKALYYVNKSIGIDDENSFYWKRFAKINSALHYYDEAEYGFRKAFEFGDVKLDTFIHWSGVLQFLGQIDSAIEIIQEAISLFPEEYELEYRLAGFCYLKNDNINGNLHLNNGLKMNYKKKIILKKYFPIVWERSDVKNQIAKFKI